MWRDPMEKFFDCEDGTATVEAVIWLPLFFWLIGASVDATLLMKAQTDLWSVASNTSRMVALNRMSPSEAKTFAVNQAGRGENYNVQVTTNGLTVETTVSRSFDDIPHFGLIPSSNRNVSAHATYRIEPTL